MREGGCCGFGRGRGRGGSHLGGDRPPVRAPDPALPDVHTFGMRFALDIVFLDAEDGGRCGWSAASAAGAGRCMPARRRRRRSRGAREYDPRHGGAPRPRHKLAGSRHSTRGCRSIATPTTSTSSSCSRRSAPRPGRRCRCTSSWRSWTTLVVRALRRGLRRLRARGDLRLARPQMKPNERILWAGLWAAATAVHGARLLLPRRRADARLAPAQPRPPHERPQPRRPGEQAASWPPR